MAGPRILHGNLVPISIMALPIEIDRQPSNGLLLKLYIYVIEIMFYDVLLIQTCDLCSNQRVLCSSIKYCLKVLLNIFIQVYTISKCLDSMDRLCHLHYWSVPNQLPIKKLKDDNNERSNFKTKTFLIKIFAYKIAILQFCSNGLETQHTCWVIWWFKTCKIWLQFNDTGAAADDIKKGFIHVI